MEIGAQCRINATTGCGARAMRHEIARLLHQNPHPGGHPRKSSRNSRDSGSGQLNLAEHNRRGGVDVPDAAAPPRYRRSSYRQNDEYDENYDEDDDEFVDDCGIVDAHRNPARLRAVDVLLTMEPNMQLKGAATRLVLAMLVFLDTTTATWAIGTLIVVGGGKATLLVLALLAHHVSYSMETTPLIEITHTIFTLNGHGLVAFSGVASLLHCMSISMESILIIETTHGVITLIGRGYLRRNLSLLYRLMIATCA
jgi:hypothetical protein